MQIGRLGWALGARFPDGEVDVPEFKNDWLAQSLVLQFGRSFYPGGHYPTFSAVGLRVAAVPVPTSPRSCLREAGEQLRQLDRETI